MMNQLDFDALPPHEKRLHLLISGVTGNYRSDAFGMEKACSVRFDHNNYPKVKALANLSGNSLNSVSNDLVQIALGVLIENMSAEEVKTLTDESKKIYNEWYEEVMKDKEVK